MAITLRNARTTIENAIVDALYLAYGVRLPVAATITSLRAYATAGESDRALRYVTSKGVTYKFSRYSTATDDGDNVVQPTDVTTGKPGRWLKTTSTVSTGYLKRADLYNDDGNNIDTLEQRLFGSVPAMLVSFDRAEHELASNPGYLYWTRYYFTILAISVNPRGDQTARQGSLVASEAAIDPGTAAMIGDAKATLAGYDLGLTDVAYADIGNEAPVVQDQARNRFVESLDIVVYATLTNDDASKTTLGEPYEFNMQLQSADTDSTGTYDEDNYVSSDGLRFAYGDGLTQSFAGGTVYLDGTAVVVAGASHLFSANKVTYRDISAAGALTYTETSVGDAPPTLGYGLTRLGVTVTDSTGVRLDRLLLSSLVNFGPVDKVELPTLTSIVISPTTISVAHGVAFQFTATGTYEDASTVDITNVVTWSSSASSVATLDASGLCTTFIAGTSNITASKSGITSNTAALTVT